MVSQQQILDKLKEEYGVDEGDLHKHQYPRDSDWKARGSEVEPRYWVKGEPIEGKYRGYVQADITTNGGFTLCCNSYEDASQRDMYKIMVFTTDNGTDQYHYFSAKAASSSSSNSKKRPSVVLGSSKPENRNKLPKNDVPEIGDSENDTSQEYGTDDDDDIL